jgi:glycosyltransferase involved in cell wall biosynthesis
MKFAAVILTKNEAQHIARCLRSVADACAEILVVDCGSTDATEAICREFGVRFVVNPWINHASQYNFGLDQLSGACDWVVRIDADEYLSPGWDAAARALIDRHGASLGGIAVRRRMRFLGKEIVWGGAASWQLRIFRASGRCEARWMDEHIIVAGDVVHSAIRLTDDNLNNVQWWTEKHIGYANREAIEVLLSEAGPAEQGGGTRVRQAAVKRFVKERIYNRLPIGLRAVLYFMLRYVVLLGFLDGGRGFLFHFLQGWWYRTLVDIRVHEITTRMRREGLDLAAAIKAETGIEISKATDPHG